MIKLSIVILNKNGRQYLKGCLSSIFNQTGRRQIEVILSDNKSSDGSIKYVKNKFKKVRIIEQEEDVGFAEGYNCGMRLAKGDWILILNSNTQLRENFIKNLFNYIEYVPEKVGMLAPEIRYFGTEKIYSRGLALGKLRLPYDIKDDVKEAEIFCPVECAAIYKKEMLEDTKMEFEYFDSDYYVREFDFDLGERANDTDWKCLPAWSCVVYKIKEKNKPKIDYDYFADRNRFWTLYKNNTPWEIFAGFPRIFSIQFGSLFYFAAKGKFKTVVKSKFDAVIGLGKMKIKKELINEKRFE